MDNFMCFYLTQAEKKESLNNRMCCGMYMYMSFLALLSENHQIYIFAHIKA